MVDADDTVLVLYGICAAEGREDAFASILDRQIGVQGAALAGIEGDTFRVVASPASRSVLRSPDAAAVLAYREAIDGIHDHRPIVPLRFGTTVGTQAAARALVARHWDKVERHLERIDGRVEVGVRLVLASPAHSADASATDGVDSGRAYLEARRAARRGSKAPVDALLASYREAAGAACVDATGKQTSESDPPVVSLAFLVPRDRAATVQDRLDAVSPDGVAEAHVVGPWTPYSFVDLRDA